MRKLGLALLTVVSAVAWSADAEKIPGIWAVPADAPVYHVSLSTVEPPEGGMMLEGIITDTLDGAPETCRRCRGELRGQPLIGMTLLSETYNQGAFWGGGTILDPISGRVWQAKFLISVDEQQVTVNMSDPASGVNIDQTWQRVE
ncbi:DUF2147 domain-containing protein [Salinibius halmophilus]|uniref:DUF2147 domain-containing protein n=1 Tax=Salinibius halmophilus TaxID=1853216 RepID=UPI0013149E5E|nr:DUF2147 domain-containing protein [Salinibius halmophilus]